MPHGSTAGGSLRKPERNLGIQAVMPGHSSLCADYVNLSAMPRIRVLATEQKKDVDGRVKPGHDVER